MKHTIKVKKTRGAAYSEKEVELIKYCVKQNPQSLIKAFNNARAAISINLGVTRTLNSIENKYYNDIRKGEKLFSIKEGSKNVKNSSKKIICIAKSQTIVINNGRIEIGDTKIFGDFQITL